MEGQMQEYSVIKKGSSINHCIKIPADFLNKDLEIKIRVLKDTGKINKKLENLYKKYLGVKPFEEITDPIKWQQEMRDEWK
jgi:hypothetical protein